MTKAQRTKAVEAAARWMDRKYPGWAEGVARVVRQGAFDIRNGRVCIIGAGTGRAWTMDDAEAISKAVIRSTGLRNLDGITSDPQLEPFWLVEVFKRMQSR